MSLKEYRKTDCAEQPKTQAQVSSPALPTWLPTLEQPHFPYLSV